MAIATKIKFLLTLLTVVSCYGGDYCYFIPPKGWDIAKPESLSPRVKISFVGRSSKGFLPSVNLATEEVNVSLAAYVDAVKKIHEADPNTRWRDLGKYNTPLGEGRLTEFETKTAVGVARLMQLMVVNKNTAYILTASALKEEFPKYYHEFEATLASLTTTENLAQAVSSPEKRQLLQTLQQRLKESLKKTEGYITTTQNRFSLPSFQREAWEPFQKRVIGEFSEMGPYWQILLLQETQNQLSTPGEL